MRSSAAAQTTLAALVLLASAAPASAFYCYVPESSGGTIPLYERPNERSRVVARMDGGMVRLVTVRREPEGWARVRWQRQPQARTFDAVGWARRDQIHGGECED